MYKFYVIFFSVAFFLSCTGVDKKKGKDSVRPNIVIILADDMGFGDIEAYNPSSKIPTPNLNTLAEEGMKFSDAHTGSSVCSPTRYGLLTGRYAWRTRLKSGVLSGYSNHLIDSGQVTIPGLLKQVGYHTAVVGKWHLGVDFPWIKGEPPQDVDNLNYCAENEIDYTKPVLNGPASVGFDYSYIVPGSLDMSPYVYLENGKATALPDSVSPLVPFPAFTRRGEIAPDFVHQTALDHLAEKAISFINEKAKSDNPFFLYFPLTGPHKPALPAKRFVGKSRHGPYGDLVIQVDWTVGEVLRALKDNGIEKNTLVIYTSDNGSYMFRIDENEPDHVDDDKVQGFHVSRRQSNFIWRGTKADIYDGGHRVPFIVRWPDNVEMQSTSTGTICLTDILATLAEINGVEIKESIGPDSFSFLSLLKGEGDFRRPPVIHHSVNGTFSVRTGKWKMIFASGSGGRQQPVGKPFQKPFQLYDVEKDPIEAENLIERQEEVANILTGYLGQIRDQGTSKNIKFD